MSADAAYRRSLGVLKALDRAASRVRLDGDEGDGPLSLRGLFTAALRGLRQREEAGAEAASARIRDFLRLQAEVAPGAMDDEAAAAEGHATDGETAAARVLARSEARLVNRADALGPDELRKLCEWEANDLLRPLNASEDGDEDATDEVDAVLLTRYLRRHLNDPSLAVTSCRQLSGGFGKETHLFSVAGHALAGDFVMRRDMPVQLIPNACHRVVPEFALIKAVREAGFETPEVLWVDTDHPEIRGGHFIIMARSPGQAGGSLFGANAAPDASLNDKLGRTVAALHRLPALTSLGDLTESIRTDLWDQPAHVAVRNYLESYLSMFLSAPHTPSPATAAVFRWLIENIPESDIPSCLVHGDIGFHNMLLDGGELVAVLDWEFAHIGHPAEDLAYAYNAGANDLDWPRVIRAYEAAGGTVIPERQFEYFRILVQARNAVSTNLASAKLFEGMVSDLKMLSGDFYFRPHILRSLGEMIAGFNARFRV